MPRSIASRAASSLRSKVFIAIAIVGACLNGAVTASCNAISDLSDGIFTQSLLRIVVRDGCVQSTSACGNEP